MYIRVILVYVQFGIASTKKLQNLQVSMYITFPRLGVVNRLGSKPVIQMIVHALFLYERRES